jgi:hypothetical protein
MPTSRAGSRAPPSRLLLIALVSFVTLCFQLLLTKLLAFVFWNHLVYLVIAIALLGYGASSTFIAVRRESVLAMEPARFVAGNLLLCGVSVVLGLVALRYFDLNPSEVLLRLDPVHIHSVVRLVPGSTVFVIIQFIGTALTLLLAYALFTLPFFFAGNVIVYLFVAHPADTTRLYCWDLAAAALGALAFVPLISIAGALGGILLCALALFAGAAALLLTERRKPHMKALFSASAVLAATALAIFPMRDTIFELKVDRQKVLSLALSQHPNALREFSKWDVISRVDVVSNSDGALDIGWHKFQANEKLVTFDGDAISHIPGRSLEFPTADDIATFERHSPLMPLLRKAIGGDHLIIGLGGGPDLSYLMMMRARSITGVEINRALIEAIQGRFAQFGGQVANRAHVRIVHSEGRSFLRREPRRYDLIYMAGTDTFTALATGAYTQAENFLYTKEAIRDYYEHLSDEGSLYVLRWFYSQEPRETLRLFATVLEALREAGIAQPERHVYIARMDATSAFGPGLMVVRKKPMTEAETTSMLGAINAHPRLKPVYLPLPTESLTADFIPESRYFSALRDLFVQGRQGEFYDGYPYDVEPTSDDRPFFFKYYTFSRLLQIGSAGAIRTGPIHGYWPYIVFLVVLCSAALAVLLFIWLPLWKFKREGLSGRGSWWSGLYFASLGTGFIMLEISLMQKFSLFLGHPMYSIAAVLGAMLLFAGLGSLVAGRTAARPLRGIFLALGILVSLIALFLAGFDALTRAALGWALWARVATAVVIIAPIAFALGQFFPLGLTLVEERQPGYMPWAWGINSGFTVIGSVLSVMIAMAMGFTAVIVLVALIYTAGVASFARYASPSAPSEPRSRAA